jgi:uncharacterized membrane protein
MVSNGYELLYLFLIYAFCGWVVETIFATLKHKKYLNRGLINGPFCSIYGIAAALITIGLHELDGFWLFVGAMIYTTVIEWIAGHLIESFFHERWWNYSKVKGNLDGYICLPASVCWGLLGFIGIKWLNPLLIKLFLLTPGIAWKIVIWVLLVMLMVDVTASFILLRGKSSRRKLWENTNSKFRRLSAKLTNWIAVHVENRIRKAYPHAAKAKQEPDFDEKEIFARGCHFYKIIMLFFVGAFLGDVVETIFCRITDGVWMSRSSVVWGTFSIVWGLAIAVVTSMLYKYREKSDGFLFLMGMFLGGSYEYFCSVFTEIVFGKVFWDYSWMPFNLGGRINLLYCFFWGIAATVWFKRLYPFISKWLEKIPLKLGKAVAWILIVFMCSDVMVSCMALVRYDQRGKGIVAAAAWQVWMDKHYDNKTMEKIYPNAKKAE